MGASFAQIWTVRDPSPAGAWCRTGLTRPKTHDSQITPDYVSLGIQYLQYSIYSNF